MNLAHAFNYSLLFNDFLSFAPVILPILVGRVISWVNSLGTNKLNTDGRVSQTGFQRTALRPTPEMLELININFEIRPKI